MAITRTAALALSVALLASAESAAQTKAPEPKPDIDLMGITHLTCIFSVSATGTWKGGEPQGQIRTGSTVSVELTEIDTQDGSAQMVGSGQSEDIVLQASAWNLHFLEVSRSGRLTMTTVFGQESKPGRLKAVHTRTDYLKVSMPGFESEPTVAQYYGDCEAKR
jgi:hypothetical protein